MSNRSLGVTGRGGSSPAPLEPGGEFREDVGKANQVLVGPYGPVSLAVAGFSPIATVIASATGHLPEWISQADGIGELAVCVGSTSLTLALTWLVSLGVVRVARTLAESNPGVGVSSF